MEITRDSTALEVLRAIADYAYRLKIDLYSRLPCSPRDQARQLDFNRFVWDTYLNLSQQDRLAQVQQKLDAEEKAQEDKLRRIIREEIALSNAVQFNPGPNATAFPVQGGLDTRNLRA